MKTKKIVLVVLSGFISCLGVIKASAEDNRLEQSLPQIYTLKDVTGTWVHGIGFSCVDILD